MDPQGPPGNVCLCVYEKGEELCKGVLSILNSRDLKFRPPLYESAFACRLGADPLRWGSRKPARSIREQLTSPQGVHLCGAPRSSSDSQ